MAQLVIVSTREVITAVRMVKTTVRAAGSVAHQKCGIADTRKEREREQQPQ